MNTLAELQRKVRDAVVRDRMEQAAPLLTGGDDPSQRLMIHRRHYESSLVTALIEKFPGTTWLLGSPLVTAAARLFVHEQPPESPCIAEYGEAFPEFVSKWTSRERETYVRQFAELEWHVGHVAVSVDRKPMAGFSLAGMDGDALAEVRFNLQPGVRYMRASWPVDRLFGAFVTEKVEETCAMEPEELWLEVRGARGEFNIRRLDAAAFAFRYALSQGESLGSASASALEADRHADPGKALIDLFADGLAVSAARRIHYRIVL